MSMPDFSISHSITLWAVILFSNKAQLREFHRCQVTPKRWIMSGVETNFLNRIFLFSSSRNPLKKIGSWKKNLKDEETVQNDVWRSFFDTWWVHFLHIPFLTKEKLSVAESGWGYFQWLNSTLETYMISIHTQWLNWTSYLLFQNCYDVRLHGF